MVILRKIRSEFWAGFCMAPAWRQHVESVGNSCQSRVHSLRSNRQDGTFAHISFNLFAEWKRIFKKQNFSSRPNAFYVNISYITASISLSINLMRKAFEWLYFKQWTSGSSTFRPEICKPGFIGRRTNEKLTTPGFPRGWRVWRLGDDMIFKHNGGLISKFCTLFTLVQFKDTLLTSIERKMFWIQQERFFFFTEARVFCESLSRRRSRIIVI